ncbi:type II toxin-antitoxin system CcdA family antitoxin [Paraburkholderia nemoris]|uniref:type II toxin-antitoxin system CcdA family antitoxin n=1 Tax=Paraburkholderia nemoris TaxID=2793076 RepID=UPI001B288AD9|nr:type II toxin-antitoxin system CcdA family antitoxin [Paraburkholderia nemoris]CAE6727334.1 hypothetical protein R75777_01874 [Paraburkholderia nemoris]
MTNIPLTEKLLSEAKSLGIDPSQATEGRLARAAADRRAEQWLKENAEAIGSYNAYVELHGLLLKKYQMF